MAEVGADDADLLVAVDAAGDGDEVFVHTRVELRRDGGVVQARLHGGGAGLGLGQGVELDLDAAVDGAQGFFVHVLA